MKISELLHSKPNKRGEDWRSFRTAVLIRDNYTCVKCGLKGTEADHIIPLCLGGADSVENGQTLCSKCHRKKTDSDLRQNSVKKKIGKYKKLNALLGEPL